MGQTAQAQFRMVRLAELRTDGRFNRPLSESKVNEILSDFNARAFRVLELWEIEPDGYIILDGQHRVEAARRRGVPDDAKCLPANIHKSLTLEQAAELFVDLNANRLVSAYDRYHALRTAGHPQSVAIDQIVRTQEMAVSAFTADGRISCVTALQRVYEMGEPSGAVLAQTLVTLRSAWGELSEAYRAPLLRGVGRYFHEHRDANPEAVATAFVRGPGAPINLLGWAKAIAGTQRVALDEAIATVIETRVMKRTQRVRSA